jgi:hypothetical protein
MAVRSATVLRPLRLTEGALTIGATGSTFANIVLDGGTLNPDDGAFIFQSTIDGSGTLTNAAGRSLTVINTTVNTPLANNGTLVVYGSASFNGGVTVAEGSRLRLELSAAEWGTYLSVGGGFTNRGTVEVAGAGEDVGGTHLLVAGLLTNFGAFSIAAGAMVEATDFRFEAGSVTGGGWLAVYGTTTFASDHTIALSSFNIEGTVEGPGRLTNPVGSTLTLGRLQGALVNAPLVNEGTLQVFGALGPGNVIESLRNAPGGTIRIEGHFLRTESALIVPGGFTNDGAIELTSDGYDAPASGARLEASTGPLVNAPGGTITTLPGAGGTRTLSGRIDNQGTITINSPTTWVNKGASTNAGAVAVTGGDLTLDQTAPGATFASTGTVTVAAGRTLTVPGGLTNGGVLAGVGTVAGGVTGPGAVSPGGPAPGRLTLTGGFAGTGPLAVDLAGPAGGTQYDQLKVTGAVSLSGPLAVTAGYAAALGDTFVILDNDGTDAVAGTFAGLPEGATLTASGQAYWISYAGGTGNDVVLTRGVPSVPRVAAVQVGDGSAQRSRVASLRVAFNTPVTFAGAPAAAFALTRQSDGAAVTFTATVGVGGSVVTLTDFAGPATEFGSLADGTYTLTVRAGQVSTPAGPLDGNGDGVGGDDYAVGLHRLYGDMNGDRAVAGADVDAFVAAFGAGAGRPAYRPDLDFNADGLVNGTDFNQFRARFAAAQGRPHVTAVRVADGSAQRSMVTALAVTFDTIVTFAGPPAAAFTLTRTSDGAAVAFTATVALTTGGRTVVTLADFAGAVAEYGSLADGNYTLTVRAGQISTPAGPLDGNGDGTGGDDYAAALYRLYGDTTGDRAVGPADLDAFKAAFGARAGTAAYRADLDVNADGYINGTDFNQFRTRFGVALPP